MLYIDTNVDSVCAHMQMWTCIHVHVCVCTDTHTHIYTQYALFYDTPASQITDTFISLGLEYAATIISNSVLGAKRKCRDGI